jgi:hypothetical protein
MGDVRPRMLIRKARPILWRRDYEGARKVVAHALRTLDDERFLALLAELADYDKRRPVSDFTRVVEWAECVFVPVLEIEGQSLRRWSDTAD